MGGGADEVLLLSSEQLWQSKESHLSLSSLACVAGTGVLQIWLRCAPLVLLACLGEPVPSSRTAAVGRHTHCLLPTHDVLDGRGVDISSLSVFDTRHN